MIYKEIKGDLFSVPEYYYLAHCISADFALGAGIAKQFDKLYDMSDKLNKYYLEQKYQCVGKAGLQRIWNCIMIKQMELLMLISTVKVKLR